MDEEKKETKKTSDIRFILSYLDGKQSLDFMKVQNTYELEGIFTDGVTEKLLLSSIVFKINHRKKIQTRTFLLSTSAVYNCSKRLKSLKRRIPLEDIVQVVVSETGDDLVIHVKDSHDLWIRSQRRLVILKCLYEAYQRSEVTEDSLDIRIVAENRIEGSLVLRKGISKSDRMIGGGPMQNMLAKAIRSKVSKKKKRYREDGFDLDLSYITPRVVAMGYPSEDVEGLYRNPFTEVKKFFETKHKDRYLIINLCSERRYDPSLFNRRVLLFPFDDHNACDLRLIYDLCVEVENWLNEHEENVVAIHCKAGKGRTGLMISAYLVYSQISANHEEALDEFAIKRTKNGKGVTIPSQKRFVEYFSELYLTLLKVGKPFPSTAPALIFTSLKFHTVPHFDKDGGCDPYIIVSKPNGDQVYDSRKQGVPIKHMTPSGSSMQDEKVQVEEFLIRGTVKIQFFDAEEFTFDDLMFQCWIDTRFIEDYLRIRKPELDVACKDKKHRMFDENFSIEMRFRKATKEEEEEQEHAGLRFAAMSIDDAKSTITNYEKQLQRHRRFIEVIIARNDDLKEEIRALRKENQHLEFNDKLLDEELLLDEFEASDNDEY